MGTDCRKSFPLRHSNVIPSFNFNLLLNMVVRTSQFWFQGDCSLPYSEHRQDVFMSACQPPQIHTGYPEIGILCQFWQVQFLCTISELAEPVLQEHCQDHRCGIHPLQRPASGAENMEMSGLNLYFESLSKIYLVQDSTPAS